MQRSIMRWACCACANRRSRSSFTLRTKPELRSRGLTPTASSAIPHLRFENVRARDLDWIWRQSESFNRFRGTEWMPEPCRSCPQREIDFGGCRCQAALLAGNAANTDPVCTLSPNRAVVDAVLCDVNSSIGRLREWTYRVNPTTSSRFESGRALG